MEAGIRSLRDLILVSLISALIAAVSVLAFQAFLARKAARPLPDKPGTAYIDAFKCERGLNKIVRIGGREDGFKTDDLEPARINPARLPNPYLEAIRDAQSGMVSLRDYDEGGQDKALIDYFELPRGLTSAQLVLVQRPYGSQTYDALRFGDIDHLKTDGQSDPYTGLPAYNYSFERHATAPLKDDKATGLLVLDLSTPAFKRSTEASPVPGPEGSVLDYLNSASRPDVLDIQIHDDTAIDFIAFIGCQTPPIAMGTSFVEFPTKPLGPEVSMLSCHGGETQRPCNPFQGDQVCTQALPLACFKPSDMPPPEGFTSAGLKNGEVRPSQPVAGVAFPDLASANAFCARQFGTGWRVLAYHDAGQVLKTRSTIPPKMRLWIDVRNQQFANCWDRDKARPKP
jgi:hypothetical protein